MIDTARQLRVFLCYSPEDKLDVREFYNRLHAEDWIYPWLDEEEVLPGMNSDIEIERAIATADAVIVFLSRNSVNKEGYIQYELNLVLDAASKKPEGAIFVIPFKLNECEIPLRIRSLQYIDYSLPETRKQAYSRLLRSLKIKSSMVNKLTGKTPAGHFISSSVKTQDNQIPDIEVRDVGTKPNATLLEFGGFSFIQIPKGKFTMGSKASNTSAREDEIPQCPCVIPYDYLISRFPVSNEQFSEFAVSTKCMSALPEDWLKKLNYPVVNVSWRDAVSYTHWLNEVFDKEILNRGIFRLPTEAEWERASRGDSAGERPWGNESLEKLLERDGSSQTMKHKIEVLRRTLVMTDVGSFSPLMDSPLGTADMMGNIVEWTQSLYAPYPYDAHDGREDLESEGERVVRGYFNSPKERFSVRSARRAHALPDRKAPILGFRIVIAPPIS